MKHRPLLSIILFAFFGVLGSCPAIAFLSPADSVTPPVITSTHAEAVTGNSALIYLSMTAPVYGTIAWIEWDTSSAFSHSTVPRSVGGSGGLSEVVTGFPQYHLIYLRGAAQYGNLIAYGGYSTISTYHDTLVPELTTLQADEITSTSARLHGRCRYYGASRRLWFGAGPSYNPYIIGADVAVDTLIDGEAEVSAIITGLVPNMTYMYTLKSGVTVGYMGVPLDGGWATFSTAPDGETGGVIIPLSVQSTVFHYSPIHFGFHTTATDTLDRPLGEAELPPPPPGGGDVRFTGVHFGLGTYNDFRPIGSAETIDTFRVVFIVDQWVYPVTVSWPALAGLFDGPVTLKYGTTLVDMKAVNEAVIDDPDLTAFRIFASGAHLVNGPPEAITNDAGNLGASHGELRGLVNPTGAATTGWFEWGTSASYGSATSEMPFGLDVAPLPASSYIFGLVGGTDYHYRIVARNANGTAQGADQVFTAPGATAVPPEASQPERFALLQNYPNPANPGTTIGYELSSAAAVRLTLFDLLGRELAVLDEGPRPPGEHVVSWDASRVATGVYFYRLDAVGANGKIVSDVKKLVIAR